MKRVLKFAAAIALLCGVAGCDDGKKESVERTVTVIFQVGSDVDVDENSYISLVREGVESSKKAFGNHEQIEFTPNSDAEAREMIEEWLSSEENRENSLLVLATNEYESLAMEYLSDGTYDEYDILLFESNVQTTSAATFCVGLYGASHLAGGVAAAAVGDGCYAAAICGSKSDQTVKDGAYGFIDGFYSSATQRDTHTYYLSDDYTGYYMADEAEQLCEDLTSSAPYKFFYPLAGASNMGVYSFTNSADGEVYSAGVDSDMSYISDYIIFSVEKHIDKLIVEYISNWVATGVLPQYQQFGLESGYIALNLASSYTEQYSSIVSSLRQASIDAEEAYYLSE